MGCLKSIFKKILFILIVVAFFFFGGAAFVREKMQQYQYPPRDVFVNSEKQYADFSHVSGDYQLYRSFNLFGYKKINAKYLPTGQKITIFDLKDESLICVSDFYTGEINDKIESILNKTKDSIITYENFEIIKKDKFFAGKKAVPYLVYKASVKNVPFKNVKGVLALYSKTNKKQEPTSMLIFSIVDDKAYNPLVVKNFVSSLRID